VGVASTAGVVLICAAVVAVNIFRNRRKFCSVDMSATGTAFLFGAGIYYGMYLLGTNFIYRQAVIHRVATARLRKEE